MGCFGCLKYTLVIFSVLYMIVGLGLLAVSLWLHFDYLKVPGDVYSQGTDYFDIALYIAMGIGGFLVLLGLMGCIGTLRISLCLLGNFAVLIVAAIGGLIAVAVLAYIYQDQVLQVGDGIIRDLMLQYERSPPRTLAMDQLQHGLKCCGAMSPVDWEIMPTQSKRIPPSCCRDPNNCQIVPNSNQFVPSGNAQQLFVSIFNEGCSTKLRSVFKQAMQIIAGLAGGISGFMLIGFIFCIAFCCVM